MGEREARALGLIMAVGAIGWFFANFWKETVITWAVITVLLWVFAILGHRSLLLYQLKALALRGARYLLGACVIEILLSGFFAISVYFTHWNQIHGIGGLWTVPYTQFNDPHGSFVTLFGFLLYLVPMLVAGAVIYIGPLYATYLGYKLLCQEVDHREEEDRLIRGRRVMPMQEALQALPQEGAVSFGFVPVGNEELKSHNFIVGATGSGKTIAVKSFLATILFEIRDCPASLRTEQVAACVSYSSPWSGSIVMQPSESVL